MAETMSEDVHLQGGHAHVQLVADMAGLGSLSSKDAVCLLVARQVGTGCKVFPTFLAEIFLFGQVLVF